MMFNSTLIGKGEKRGGREGRERGRRERVRESRR
jgi:hypothetical protein